MRYLFNVGAVLTNAGKVDDAIVAFDKVIAADPTKADAYYWKGVNMIGKETLGKDDKMIAPTGTAEAFQKYLELATERQVGSASQRHAGQHRRHRGNRLRKEKTGEVANTSYQF